MPQHIGDEHGVIRPNIKFPTKDKNDPSTFDTDLDRQLKEMGDAYIADKELKELGDQFLINKKALEPAVNKLPVANDKAPTFRLDDKINIGRVINVS